MAHLGVEPLHEKTACMILTDLLLLTMPLESLILPYVKFEWSEF